MDCGSVRQGEGRPPMKQLPKLMVVALFIALAVAFALFAYNSPVKTQPIACFAGGGGGNRRPLAFSVPASMTTPELAPAVSQLLLYKFGGYTQVAFCAPANMATPGFAPVVTQLLFKSGGYTQMAFCAPANMTTRGFAPVVSQFLLFKSYAQISEGFAALALLFPLLTSPTIVKRLDFSWLHRPLAPRFPRRLLVPLVLVGASIFALFAIVDATYYDTVFSRTFVNAIAVNSSYYYGVISFGTWFATVALLTLRRGFLGAMKVFGLPAILFLEAVLLMFLPRAMPIHVTQFANWSAGVIDLVSNWFVLMIASFLFILGLTYKKLGLHRDLRLQGS